ncbi:MAG: pyrroloquinoline quinone-dependent dehydrogenase [Saprospiraceae bacterium]
MNESDEIKFGKSLAVLAVFGLLLFIHCKENSSPYEQWNTYRGTPDARQFSALNFIDTSNVDLLQPAWIFHTGDTTPRTIIECNPIIIDTIIYVTSPALHLIALNATTGKEIWRFRPYGQETTSGINRGVTYWPDNQDGCIFFSSGKYMYAVNALTGLLINTFGQEGKIDLRMQLGKDTSHISISLTTPGIIYKDLLIIGSATGEGYDASPGHVRAYDAHTGALRWIFHTIPQENEAGHDTWQWLEHENYGGTNNWGGMSLDEKRGVVYVANGSPTYDFYGANRLGSNLYGNCVIALDALSGKKIWHYQLVKHDIWDYDLPCAPTLATVPWLGKNKDILIQPTKMGQLVLLDRETGIPLLNIDERPVPSSDVPGEKANATQTFNHGIILSSQGWDSSRVTDISDSAQKYVLAQARKYKQKGMYTPPSMMGTLAQPGTRGGMEWGGISYNPANNTVYANCNDFPMILQLERVKKSGPGESGKYLGETTYMLNCSNCHGGDHQGNREGIPGLSRLANKYKPVEIKKIITQGKGLMPAHTQFSNDILDALIDYLATDTIPGDSQKDSTSIGVEKYVLKGFRIFTDQEGYPANKPPWGTLNAVDVSSGHIKWSVPLGYYPALKARGLSSTGTQNFGGCVATAGGLVFIGATPDEMFRAFDANSGKELWSYKLPAGGYATPAIYRSGKKQYVVIAAGGGNRNGTPSGDAYIAFTIPDR